jgi:hypothetical protein
MMKAILLDPHFLKLWLWFNVKNHILGGPPHSHLYTKLPWMMSFFHMLPKKSRFKYSTLTFGSINLH